MRKPNFFIIGAPKCGTTSLASWLAEHPQVFFSPVKEPSFFNFDFGKRFFRTLSEYEKCFYESKDEHIAIGEGSAWYLYSRTAVPAIIKYTKFPRFIVMIRNPVDMVCSLHEQELFTGYETENDFNCAWSLQEIRLYGDQIPKTCVDPQVLFYGDRCKIGLQIKRLLKIVPREQILFLNLDQIKQDPRNEYIKTLNFLELKDDGRKHFPVFNSAKKRTFPILWYSINRLNTILDGVGVPHIRLGFTSFIDYRTRKEHHRSPISGEMKDCLRNYFKEDIILLESLTGLDLTNWKNDG
jgi:hypothetical protein